MMAQLKQCRTAILGVTMKETGLLASTVEIMGKFRIERTVRSLSRIWLREMMRFQICLV